MPHLFGHDYSVQELRQMTSTMDQIAGIRLYEYSDGKARGLRAADVWTGSGFRFQIFIDRAMDIGSAEYNGTPLAWVHPALGGPGLFDPYGYGWGRTWGGGLVTTAGLTFFGHPETDEGEALSLHGRIAHTAAERVAVVTEWLGADYVLEISGQTRQVVTGAENLLLKRKISTKLGANSFVVEDTVINEAMREVPHMILYHCNFGFPVVSPDSEILLNLASVKARDARAEAGIDNYTHFDEPSNPNFPEQVFFHKPNVDADGNVHTAIVNRKINFGAFLNYRAAELPYLAEWKQMSSGDYVCALEPANQWETPRHKLREEGRLKFMAPGESISYRLEFGALPDAAAISNFEDTLHQKSN